MVASTRSLASRVGYIFCMSVALRSATVSVGFVGME